MFLNLLAHPQALLHIQWSCHPLGSNIIKYQVTLTHVLGICCGIRDVMQRQKLIKLRQLHLFVVHVGRENSITIVS